MADKAATWTRTLACSDTAKRSRNYIREIMENMVIKPNKDLDMISLSIGDPAVFGNFDPCVETVDAVLDTVKGGKANGYLHSCGAPEARRAVAAHVTTGTAPITEEDVVLASGCSGALDLAITVLCNAGHNILLPQPGFPLYQTLAESKGVEVRFYKCDAAKNWAIDIDHLESLIDEKTACILINNPSNPCGSNFDEAHLKDILALADRRQLPIIADEIYADMVFDGVYTSLASLSTSVPILSVGGLAKRYMVPGWRLGWVLVHDRQDLFKESVTPGLKRLSQLLLGPSSPVQLALPKILADTPQSFYDERLAELKLNAETSFEMLSEVEGLRPIKPQGAMYLMVEVEMAKFKDIGSDMQFVETLVSEQSVFCLPGSCFGAPNFFRIVTCPPKAKLNEAYTRIGTFCAAHRK